jgi:hypothetical protein
MKTYKKNIKSGRKTKKTIGGKTFSSSKPLDYFIKKMK